MKTKKVGTIKLIFLGLFIVISMFPLIVMAGEENTEPKVLPIAIENEINDEDAKETEIVVLEEYQAAGVIASEKAAEIDETGIIIDLEDNEVPLVRVPTAKDGRKKLTWIWAIMIGLLGAAGYEAYRQYAKKDAEQYEENM